MNISTWKPGITPQSNTVYTADRKIYDIYPEDAKETIPCWWSSFVSDDQPLKAAFVFRKLENVTIDLGGAKLVFHGRILPFAVYDCSNITFRNFSIDYDRPFYTEGTILESGARSVVIQIPELFTYRIEGHDFIAMGETWEHRLVAGDMLFRCMNPETGRPSSGTILGLIGDKIYPWDNPPLPIHHLYADDLGNHCVRIWNLPESFRPPVGHILAMTHEDRRKTGFLLERDTDTVIEHVRLYHVGAMGLTANLCHNISVNDYSMFPDKDCPNRHITINADGFHAFHCTGLMKIENCRFENLLDDAVNIHGNYLVCISNPDSKTLITKNRPAGIKGMEYFLPGDSMVAYRKNTKEIRAKGIIDSAAYSPGDKSVIKIILKNELTERVEPGDFIENLRMPDIEIRNCRTNAAGGFRISSGKHVLIEECQFETEGFSILFSGDMDYWYENTGVKDVTIHNCTFERCGSPLQTECGFQPTAAAPYYHENIHFLDNTVHAPIQAVMNMKDVNGIELRGNRITGLREGQLPFILQDCSHVYITY